MKLLKYKKGLKILDIGRFENSLEILNRDFISNNDITILNIENVVNYNKNVKFVLGDTTDENLFPTKHFDVIHCNSVIEHVGDVEKHKRLTQNIRIWGKWYFVQTPAYCFPFEPHFLVPFFQYLPHKFRAHFLNKFSLGTFQRKYNYFDTLTVVSSVRLLNEEEFKSFFPEAIILKERILFITKSYIAHNID